MAMIIGMDVHSKKTVYVAQNEEGKVIKEGAVTTGVEGMEQMLAALNAPEQTRIGLETGTQATWISRLLASMGMNPVVIDAREVRAKARRIGQKSDRRDAFEICDGLRRGIYTTIVFVPDAPTQRLRQILSRRRHFVKLCTGQVNAAKFLLRAVGLSGQASYLRTEAAWQKLLAKPALASLHDHLAMHAEVWKVAHQHVQRLEKELKEAVVFAEKERQRLMTVPGVGPITASSFIAVLANTDRFPTSSHAASYIGLVPSTYDSGETERHGRITKRGSGELRTLLCEAAHHAARPAHPLNPYWRRIAAKAGYQKAVVAVAHRLARILFQMWRNGEDFDVRKLNVVYDGKALVRKRYYKIATAAEAALRS